MESETVNTNPSGTRQGLFRLVSGGMPLYDDTLKRVEREIRNRYGSVRKFADFADVNPTMLTRWFSKSRVADFGKLSSILETLGAKVTFPEDEKDVAKDVCFVAPQRLNVEDMGNPIPEDYIAVPLAEGSVAAGRGMVPDDFIKSWVLVWKNHDSVRFRTNLIAVEIGKGQDSMVPTLHPQDILLVDRDDFKDRFAPPGNIFLVREPDDSVTVKRVSIKQKNGDMMLTFYSDNVEHAPTLYSLTEEYGGDIDRAVIGRVVWAWSDMSRK